MNKQDLLNPLKMQEVAINASIRGGRIIKKYWGDLDLTQISNKSSWRDIVTIADKESEAIVLKTIEEHYPEHGIISEEGGGLKNESSQYQWAIDPLDGTTNFRHSYPFFCVSIGILKDNKPHIGVVYDPIHDELFTAIKGMGAFMNGRPIKVSNVSSLRDSLLVTGFAYNAGVLQESSMELFKKLNFTTHGVRRDGAAALDLCFVAAGRLEAFWEYGLHIWDIAAGAVIVEEAGGLVRGLIDETLDLQTGNILANNKLINDELLKEIQASNNTKCPIG